jgi:hypothetical protein
MLGIAFIISVILLLVLQISLSLSLGKKYDELLQKNNLILPISANILLPQKWMRAGTYASMIAWNISCKNPKSFRYKNYKKRFGNFNFRTHATNKEVTLSKLYVLAIIICACLLILILIKATQL